MQPLLHLLGLLLALPLVGWSLLLLAIERTTLSTNGLELLLELLLAYLWAVPIIVVTALALAVAGILRRSRRVAAGLLIAVNVVALAIVFAVMGPPPGAAEAVFLLPSVVSILLAALVVGAPRAG